VLAVRVHGNAAEKWSALGHGPEKKKTVAEQSSRIWSPSRLLPGFCSATRPRRGRKDIFKDRRWDGSLLKTLDHEQRGPNEDELESLLGFIAIQWVRVPAFRPTILRIADSIYRAEFSKALRNPEAWARMLKKVGISADSPDFGYEQMSESERSGNYSLSAENEWYLLRAFEGAKTIIPLLMARHWGVSISRKGSFIGSDNPVVLDGPKGEMVGFKNADIVIYPVSRHILLYGTKLVQRSPFVNQMYIARQNTFMMLTAEEQVFSVMPTFCWLDEKDGYQTDWRLFSKEKFL
jgi:hypothetical protein